MSYATKYFKYFAVKVSTKLLMATCKRGPRDKCGNSAQK